MIVAKIGGSLLSNKQALPICFKAVQRLSKANRIVLVPGGGELAEQVRQLQHRFSFNDRAAHAMAILAMQQAALLLNALQAEWPIFSYTQDFHKVRAAVSIWSPELAELDQAGVAASWDVTSDSLAAWLAIQLRADELILVKSAKIDENAAIEQLQKSAVVDAAFQQFVDQADFPIKILHYQQL